MLLYWSFWNCGCADAALLLLSIQHAEAHTFIQHTVSGVTFGFTSDQTHTHTRVSVHERTTDDFLLFDMHLTVLNVHIVIIAGAFIAVYHIITIADSVLVTGSM